MSIKKVKCRACNREFDEDKINMINNKYLCADCLKTKAKEIRDIRAFLIRGNHKVYITMSDDNVENLAYMFNKLKDLHEETSKLISKIRKHIDYFKNEYRNKDDL